MDLKTFIPKFIRQVLDDAPRKTITNERWNELWNLAITQGDWNAETLQQVVTELLSTEELLNQNVIATELNTLFRQAHPVGNDHDTRYYTKSELDPMLRSGDTLIKGEVFTIVNSNLGNGTFSYQNAEGVTTIGTITPEGYQVFTLEKGNYVPGENRVEATINDTLHRSVISGGLVEVDNTHVALTQAEGNGAEITFEYFEKIGLAGEHGITHEVNQGDETAGLTYVGTVAPVNGKAIWFKVVG